MSIHVSTHVEAYRRGRYFSKKIKNIKVARTCFLNSIHCHWGLGSGGLWGLGLTLEGSEARVPDFGRGTSFSGALCSNGSLAALDELVLGLPLISTLVLLEVKSRIP